MSATLEAEKISAYFGGCPVLSVPGRTFPVDVQFLEDAVQLTGWKVTEGSAYARRGMKSFARHFDFLLRVGQARINSTVTRLESGQKTPRPVKMTTRTKHNKKT